jgi:DNA modification methylase
MSTILPTSKHADYDKFIASKVRVENGYGFEPIEIQAPLFDWQKHVLKWAVRRGRCALFEDCGLGKTLQQLEWARQVVSHTGGKVLILTPLAVAQQTEQEAKRFGYSASVASSQSEVNDAITITNYEKLDHFDVSKFDGVVLDESSCLKNFMGATRIKLTKAFAHTPYRLCCTATPAPNDYMEFGQHCEFLGIMPSNEMLSRWFINDTMNFGTYRLKGHAMDDFWRWVASWAACISKPSDIGFSDDGYILPKLNMKTVIVDVDEVDGRDDGELLRIPTMSATTMHKEMRMTSDARARKVAEMVNASNEPWIIWCNTNDEADRLCALIPDAVEVRGSDSEKSKEKNLGDFTNQRVAKIITKPSIAGMGLHWAHCSNVAFVGLSYSFEDFYQALRRSYRFGQQKEVNAYIVQARTEGAILKVINEKMEAHKQMQDEMKKAAAYMVNKKDEELLYNQGTPSRNESNWTIYNGDCVRVARELPDNSIDFSVYSPPFASLYIYSSDVQDMGNCKSDDEFFEHYRFLIREKLRATKPGCLSAVHCKNLVNYSGRDGHAGLRDFRGEIIKAHRETEHDGAIWAYHSEITIWKDPVIEMQRTKAQGLLYKQLRQNSKFTRMGMAEYLIIFRKWTDDVEAMNSNPVEREKSQFPLDQWQQWASPVWMDVNQTKVLNVQAARDEKHICPLQLDVIERAITLWSNPGDLVYSPFTGIGSEGYQALKMGRRFVGSELKESYFKQACQNLTNATRQQEFVLQ